MSEEHTPEAESEHHDSLPAAWREIERLKAELAELEARDEGRDTAWKRWLAAVGTASVTLLAFLIPSLQEQWDRKQQSDAESEYRAIADTLLRDGHYAEAQQLLAQAAEQASGLRPDLERARLRAKTEQVNTDPAWSGSIAADVSEGDFIVLEAMLARARDRAGEAWALNNHAVFVAHGGELARALTLIERAERLQPADPRLEVTRGNLLWDLGSLEAARAAYRAALLRDPHNARAHYNLGLLYEELGDLPHAAAELRALAGHERDKDVREDLVRIEGEMPQDPAQRPHA
jgi:Flp pilus assembly protein TadD